jgi:alpha-beta hydrolase superfamily lysophospholipase
MRKVSIQMSPSRRSRGVDSHLTASGMRSARRLFLRQPGRRQVIGVVLVLHGGKVSSVERTAAWQPAVLRLTLLAWAIRRRLDPHGIAVARLRFSIRGWNGPEASPVADARWALQRIRDHIDAPIVIVGHSMGARAAVRVAGDPAVAGVIGLAPWLPPAESVEFLAGRQLLIAHGTADRITDPALSAAFAQRAKAVASDVNVEFIPGDGHAMLRKAGLWHRLTAGQARKMIREHANGMPR